MDDFEKSLTKEEIEAPTYFDWSNETLGRAARWMAEKFKQHSPDGFKGVTILGACYHLINTCRDTNAGELKLTLDNFTYKKENTGDWEIIVRKKPSGSEKV